MANPFAGEVEIVVDGQPRVAKLTLGALAELEAAMGDDTLAALIQRFEGGGFRAQDVMALLVAGLRGGGWDVRAEDLVAAEIAGGPVAAAQAAAKLLVGAFAPFSQ
ncbi:MAG: gene transfer agent family protein [Shimia sp.]